MRIRKICRSCRPRRRDRVVLRVAGGGRQQRLAQDAGTLDASAFARCGSCGGAGPRAGACGGCAPSSTLMPEPAPRPPRRHRRARAAPIWRPATVTRYWASCVPGRAERRNRASAPSVCDLPARDRGTSGCRSAAGWRILRPRDLAKSSIAALLAFTATGLNRRDASRRRIPSLAFSVTSRFSCEPILARCPVFDGCA